MRRLLSISVLLLLATGVVALSGKAADEEGNGRYPHNTTHPPLLKATPHISGTLQKWHPLTFSFDGPAAAETDVAPNPFLDYRFIMIFTAPSGREIQVPGFFDGDGQGGGTGSIWRVRFAPDETGTWQYRTSFHLGTDIAIDLDLNAGTPTSFDNSQGNFTITAQGCYDPGFLKWGRLEYVGAHYLKFNDGSYWIKGGTDSPENLLGYNGFDNTVDQGGLIDDFLHEYPDHVADWQPNDPNFISADTGYDGKGLIGALNYLSDRHINSIYFLPMNLGGDGQETYPFIDPANESYAKTHYDISKLTQWNIVFDHAQRKGIALHILLAETEPPNEQWLDGGQLGVERKLFYREMVARFGYILAIKWNLSEENDYLVVQLQQFSDYIQQLDWAQHPITVHTHLNDETYYNFIKGDSRFSATSFQYNNFDVVGVNYLVEKWRQESTLAGRPWVIDMDENFHNLTSSNEDKLRSNALYPIYFSGGNIEWYLGYYDLPLGGDLQLENFRTRQQMWDYTWYARKFMLENLPFWEMIPQDHLLTEETWGEWGMGQVFAKHGRSYALYLPVADGNGRFDLGAESGTWVKRWYNPRTGNFAEDITTVLAGDVVSIGFPPDDVAADWVVLFEPQPPTSTFSMESNALDMLYLPLIMDACPYILE